MQRHLAHMREGTTYGVQGRLREESYLKLSRKILRSGQSHKGRSFNLKVARKLNINQSSHKELPEHRNRMLVSFIYI